MSVNSPSEDVTLRKRDAVRILFIIDAAGTKPGNGAPAGAVKELHAEMKLQALDFWVRNPDYLANEMIRLHQEVDPKAGWLKSAVDILKNGEPEIRRLAMLRYLFGAWEAVQDAVGTLRLYGMVEHSRKIKAGKASDTTYYLMEDGATKAAEWGQHSALKWYAERARLVASVAGARNGTSLKKQQHEVERYHATAHHAYIPPIYDEVKEKLATLGIQI